MNWRQLSFMLVVVALSSAASAQMHRGGGHRDDDWRRGQGHDRRGGDWGRGGDWDRGGDHRNDRRARVCFYEHVNFSGASFCLSEGETSQNLVSSGWNDRISSIAIEGAADVTVYVNTFFSGQSVRIFQSTSDLRALGLNDAISSISTGFSRPQPRPQPPPQRRGRVCFYEHVNYAGASLCLAEGEQNVNLVASGWNDRASSVLIEGHVKVYVYQNIHMGGAYIEIRSSTADLRTLGWNDVISSMNVLNASIR